MNENIITAILADDHHMVRESLATMLTSTAEISVVAQAASGEEALAELSNCSVDVLVLDYSMPGMDALTVVTEVSKLYPQTKIIMLTMHEHVEYAVRCLEAGANAYMLKSDAVLKLIDAVKAVVDGEVFVSDSIKQALAGAMDARASGEQVGLESLSQREFEMLGLLAKGLRVNDCAREMGISESSASTYRRRIMQKLNLKTLGELVSWATRQGLAG